MRIAIGSDHAGFSLKEFLKESLAKMGHEVLDHGPHSDESVDYPDFAKAVAYDVNSKKVERGVLICGSGAGMCMAANRFPEVRAAVLSDEYDAQMCRRHNDANVACFGARKIEAARAQELIDIFLKTPFDGGRHEARVKKLSEIC
ncbi:MAG: ribose 5-phosphate isomerase B [Pseudomonadota bacterium]